MRMVLGILAALFLSLTAQARLGETEAQLLERFGKPWKRGGMKAPSPEKCFAWHPSTEMAVAGWTYEGRAAWLEYYCRGAGNKLTPVEVQGILDANAAGFTWSLWKPGSKVWVRSDRQAIAEVEERKVTVYDVDFAKAVSAARHEAIAALEAAEEERQAESQKPQPKAEPGAAESRVSKF